MTTSKRVPSWLYVQKRITFFRAFAFRSAFAVLLQAFCLLKGLILAPRSFRSQGSCNATGLPRLRFDWCSRICPVQTELDSTGNGLLFVRTGKRPGAILLFRFRLSGCCCGRLLFHRKRIPALALLLALANCSPVSPSLF